MDGRQADYSQSGLSSPYPHFPDHHSEAASSDPASAAQYPQAQDPRAANNFSSSATPTSEYGINPSSARSGSFPEYIQPRAPPYSGQAPNAGPMAQTSPSMPLADGQNNHHNSHRNSDNDVPIDPSIAAATSPTYAQHQQYSPYTPQHDMGHYAGHPGTPSPMYGGGRPEWGGQYPPGGHQLSPYGQHPSSSAPPTPAMGGHPLSTVYSFVPIPGAQQHKRPRRRYEEIERMYKCGWNGCEKAYGTLNHLNAHVTMQSHGAKRTPEEFKEIRKEWKAKKKEEEAARKADDERQRAADGRPEGGGDGQPVYGGIRSQMPPGQMGGPQLPPIGYAPASGGQAPPYGSQGPGMPDGLPQYAPNHPPYSNGGAHNSSNSYPQSPYGQNQMYQQPSDNGPNNYQQ